MRWYRLRRIIITLYRLVVGDVQVIHKPTDNTLERTIYLGYLDSNELETRIFYTVKQIRYLKIYSRWWINERPEYVYQVNYIKLVGNQVLATGEVTYPELCVPFLRWTKRPHLLAIDCHLKTMLAAYS